MKNVREFYTLDLYTCTCLYILNVAVRPFPSPSFDAVKSETHREKEYDDFLGRGYGATMTLQLPILAASYRQCRSGTEAGLRNRALHGQDAQSCVALPVCLAHVPHRSATDCEARPMDKEAGIRDWM